MSPLLLAIVLLALVASSGIGVHELVANPRSIAASVQFAVPLLILVVTIAATDPPSMKAIGGVEDLIRPGILLGIAVLAGIGTALALRGGPRPVGMASVKALLAAGIVAAPFVGTDFGKDRAAVQGVATVELRRTGTPPARAATSRLPTPPSGSLYFSSDWSTLDPVAMTVVREWARFLKANDGLDVEITGRSSGKGPAAQNVEIAQRIAERVRMAMLQEGVDAKRVLTKADVSTAPTTPSADLALVKR